MTWMRENSVNSNVRFGEKLFTHPKEQISTAAETLSIFQVISLVSVICCFSLATQADLRREFMSMVSGGFLVGFLTTKKRQQAVKLNRIKLVEIPDRCGLIYIMDSIYNAC